MIQVHGLGYKAPELRPDQLPHNGTPTSIEAAQRASSHAQSDAERIAEFISQRGEIGATTDECEVALGLSHQTASARMRSLQIKQRIMDLGERRKTRTGCNAVVWFSVEQAKP